ncbi:MAG: non-homologous end-joining DNA ligase [Solirubrobacteraceae bacterium]
MPDRPERVVVEGGLEPYRAKRDFGATPEPPGAQDATEAHRFVIQEHHARRLHWDLRLERDGVLASWAVPKGLPESPGTNHFAARTEDHPLEYIDFHGEIPRGQYGAGSMRIWDQGTYETLKWEPRKVEVRLHGERLDGRYALFAIGRQEAPKDWMVHRMDPPADADREPMPERLLPMLARRGRLPDGDEWAYEICWAGERAIAYSQPGVLRFEGRDLRDLTGRYPELGRLNRALSSHSAVLDGVIVAHGGNSEALERRAAAAAPAQVRRLSAELPVNYVIFDALWVDGRSLLALPYVERRERLAGLRLSGERWQTPDHVVGQGEAVLAASAAHGFGGVVAKRLDSAYAPGRRARSWTEVTEADPEQATDAEGADRPLVPEDSAASATVVALGRELRLSNLDKVLYPATGTTKRAVINYYAAIAPVVLGHLRGRALTVKRWPDGVAGKSFFQKQSPAHRPDWVRTAGLPGGGKVIEYTVADDLPTLIWLANLAALELHAPLAVAAAPQRPTAVVFDLDPGAPATVVECCDVALRLQGMFEHLGLESFAKTSGSKGLQVYVPLGAPDVTFEQTRSFARMVAELLAADEPDLVVSRMTPALRTGRVFVDWSQNDRQKTTVCAYSLRARESPTVSTPLEWDEVRGALDSGDPGELAFDYEQVLGRVAEQGDLFAPVLSLRQKLPGV